MNAIWLTIAASQTGRRLKERRRRDGAAASPESRGSSPAAEAWSPFVKWDLGLFGKLHVRHGKGARGSGPRERMVPLINGAGRTLRWFIEDVWGHFDADYARPGAPLFPSERKNRDGSCGRSGPRRRLQAARRTGVGGIPS